MLELVDLSKSHVSGSALFAEVSLRLAPGEVVAVLGESGVGKSTLLNCVAGLEPLDAGAMALDGAPLHALDEDAFALLRREKYGFVFQAFHVLPHLSLEQNVALPLWLLGVSEREAAQRARDMLGRVGLGERADDWPRTLSGGELQRVAIARALVHGPRLVLADEPTGNLDPELAGSVIDLLVDEVRKAQAMAILVTHSLQAARRADRMLRLTRSGLVAENAV